MITRPRAQKTSPVLVALAALALLASCASDKYPAPYVAESVDDPTVFVGSTVNEPLGDGERAVHEDRVTEIRFVLGEQNRPDGQLDGLWRTTEGEIFCCTARSSERWVFHPLAPFQIGGTTAEGTEDRFLTLDRSSPGYTGEVDGTGILPGEDPDMVEVTASLDPSGQRLTLTHEPDGTGGDPLSLTLLRGLSTEGRLTLERELALRLERLGVGSNPARPPQDD